MAEGLDMAGEDNENQQPPAEVNAARINKLPVFFPDSPKTWFTQIEALFSINNITKDETKFNYVVAHAS